MSPGCLGTKLSFANGAFYHGVFKYGLIRWSKDLFNWSGQGVREPCVRLVSLSERWFVNQVHDILVYHFLYFLFDRRLVSISSGCPASFLDIRQALHYSEFEV